MKQDIYKVFLPSSIKTNNVTEYYIQIIEEVVRRLGCEVVRISDISDIDTEDKCITISAGVPFMLLRRNRKQYIINWYQGIIPEENLHIHPERKLKYLNYMISCFYEYVNLRYCKKNIFVSKEMKRHYEKKYKVTNFDYSIMPCFNQELDTSSFTYAKKYTEPKFVYAGSMEKWQCVDRMLEIMEMVQQSIAEASLTIITTQIEEAKQLVAKYRVHGVTIKGNIPFYEMDKELKQYKYGFLVRDNLKLNNVATPTKLGSYLASGIMPIVSDVIVDFKDNFSNCSYFIWDSYSQQDKVVKRIIDFEKKVIQPDLIEQEFVKIFGSYYCREKYVKQIMNFLKK